MNKSANAFPELTLDENGLLLNPDEWSGTIAEQIAVQLDIPELSKDHWKVIDALRLHYERFGVAPAMHNICQANHKSKDWVRKLFHNCLNAWRVAGLPDPGEEAKSYLSDM